MHRWFLYALAALVLLGVQRFLYKVSAERNCNTAWTTCAFMATVTVISLAVLAVQRPATGNLAVLLLLGALNSAAFVTGTMTHMEALKHLSAGIVYPIIRLSVVLVVALSVLVFGERLSGTQILGIAAAVAVILILTGQAEGRLGARRRTHRGFVLVAVSLVSGAAASISSKLAAIYVDTVAFMAVSYFLSTVGSFGLRRKLATDARDGSIRTALAIGLIMGVINFAGYYLFLKALSAGPLSIIISLVGMHFVIAVILSVALYKEKLNPPKIVGILLTVFSIILLRG